MGVIGVTKKGGYYDSITVMLIAKRLSDIAGVADSAVVMGTPENKSALGSAGLLAGEALSAGENDLIVAARTSPGADEALILAGIEELLRAKGPEGPAETVRSRSLEGGLKLMPEANLALISVAGRYAGDVAMRSLERGLNVMLFSDNVPLAQEIALKEYARKKGLFVMGPDCGTAIIGGVPLAFANVVRRGAIGIVGASGTGIQETSSIISNAGCGISQAVGTGGRDVTKEVGGIMFIEGMRVLARDEATVVILLVSKPPAEEVFKKIISEAKKIPKPVVGIFLGAPSGLLGESAIVWAPDLERGALLSAALSVGGDASAVDGIINKRDAALRESAKEEAKRLSSGGIYLRGLFSGGTFCDEAQVLCHDSAVEVFSNVPFGRSRKLKDNRTSEKHTLLDLGDDEFTVGRPHPMIDYSLRSRRLLQEAEDPATAVILMDVVLGCGSNPDPLAELLPVIGTARKKAASGGRHLTIVCSVTGTDRDPQNRSAVVSGLTASGALVKESSSAACKLALAIVDERSALS